MTPDITFINARDLEFAAKLIGQFNCGMAGRSLSGDRGNRNDSADAADIWLRGLDTMQAIADMDSRIAQGKAP